MEQKSDNLLHRWQVYERFTELKESYSICWLREWKCQHINNQYFQKRIMIYLIWSELRCLFRFLIHIFLWLTEIAFWYRSFGTHINCSQPICKANEWVSKNFVVNIQFQRLECHTQEPSSFKKKMNKLYPKRTILMSVNK